MHNHRPVISSSGGHRLAWAAQTGPTACAGQAVATLRHRDGHRRTAADALPATHHAGQPHGQPTMIKSRFDELIHAPTRLSIVSLLAATEWADFAFIPRQPGTLRLGTVQTTEHPGRGRLKLAGSRIRMARIHASAVDRWLSAWLAASRSCSGMSELVNRSNGAGQVSQSSVLQEAHQPPWSVMAKGELDLSYGHLPPM
jgi:hypothetical protein